MRGKRKGGKEKRDGGREGNREGGKEGWRRLRVMQNLIKSWKKIY